MASKAEVQAAHKAEVQVASKAEVQVASKAEIKRLNISIRSINKTRLLSISKNRRLVRKKQSIIIVASVEKGEPKLLNTAKNCRIPTTDKSRKRNI